MRDFFPIHRRRWRVMAICLPALIGQGLPVAAQKEFAPVAAFASSPLDARLYRPDAIRHFQHHAGAWKLACEEIIPLKRRFCSLSTIVSLRQGPQLAALTLSTGQNGRPAALLRMPHGTILARGAQLRAGQGKGGKASKPGAQRRLRPAACDQGGCTFIFEPARAELLALREGHALHIIFWRWKAARDGWIAPSLADPAQHEQITLRISGEGFAQAMAAGMQ